jgi:hypothetical protein
MEILGPQPAVVLHAAYRIATPGLEGVLARIGFDLGRPLGTAGGLLLRQKSAPVGLQELEDRVRHLIFGDEASSHFIRNFQGDIAGTILRWY